jgi:hypothetical protein
MKFARYTFLIAGIYGLLVLLPQYFLENRIGADSPPAITHPEFFYGFIGVAVAFQLVFLTIATDPRRYRLLILPSLVEKYSFVVAAVVLQMQGRIAPPMLAGAMIDAVLGLLFLASWFKLRPEPAQNFQRLK